MTEKLSHIKSKSSLNYFVDILLFLPFLLLLVTGIIMLIYHIGQPNQVEIIGLNGNVWLTIHKVLSLIVSPLVVLHLLLHFNWLKKLFSLNLKTKHSVTNIILFVFFILCLLTSLLSWFVFTDSKIGDGLRGIHNKLGMVLIIFFMVHVTVYFKWIVAKTRQVFKKLINN